MILDEMTLLHLLDSDPRASYTKLADILGADEKSVEKSIKKLENEKVICGYHTVINWDNTSQERVQAIIEVSAKPERDRGYDKLAERIARFPEVSDLFLMSGKSEFFLMMEGKTMREVADFVGQKLAPLDGVTATVTCFVLKKYKVNNVLFEIEKPEDERQLITA